MPLGRRGENLLVQSEAEGIANAKAGNFGRDMSQATLVIARAQVHVYPWGVVLNEFGEETAREDVIAGAFYAALLQVGDVTFQFFEKFPNVSGLAYKRHIAQANLCDW